MLNSKEFRTRLQDFSLDYMNDFDDLWRWKIGIEREDSHLLDSTHCKETCGRLGRVLQRWQAYRPYSYQDKRSILERSLQKIAPAYDQIRRYSLLQFNDIPDEPLKMIWHELGRVKQQDGVRTGGSYLIIAICKPLMLLWGQTLAFDSRNRAKIPPELEVSEGRRWMFGMWRNTMEHFQRVLVRSPEIVAEFKKESLARYGTDKEVPYGRFLDIYYF